MDQQSSPPPPSASFTGIRSHHGGLEMLAGAKKRAVGGDVDDSSSIITSTSKSSATKEQRDTQCKKCKEPHKATRPLFKCTKCKYKWHENCHDPTPTKSSEFNCSSCTRKLRTTAVQAPQPSSFVMSYNLQGEAVLKETGSKIKASAVCEKSGCTIPLFSMKSGGPPLCKRHEMEEKHKQASSRPAAAPNPANVSRQIDKSKLYRPRPDDKQFIIKSTKRKRAPSSGEPVPSMRVYHAPKDKQVKSPVRPPSSRSTQYDEFGAADVGNAMHAGILSSPTIGSGIPLHSPAHRIVIYEEADRQSTNIFDRLNLESPTAVSPLEVRLVSPEFLRSAQGQSSEESSTDVPLRLGSARTTALAVDDSPDYSPPPPNVPADNTNPWSQEEQSGTCPNTPGSQIEQELRHDADITGQLRKQPASDLPLQNGNDDQLDPVTFAHINQLTDEYAAGIRNASTDLDRASPEPIDTAMAMSNADVFKQVPETRHLSPPLPRFEEGSSVFQEPTSMLDAARRKFDATALDSFLTDQTQHLKLEPDARQLLRTQNWGTVDPRLEWRQSLSPEEREEKMREIEARGSRKSNFGKLLTPEVRQQRLDNGWEIHQTTDWRDSEEIRDMIRHLQELFGVPRIDDFIPAMRSGRLVMLEREEPELIQTGPGRRKKKDIPREFIMRYQG